MKAASYQGKALDYEDQMEAFHLEERNSVAPGIA